LSGLNELSDGTLYSHWSDTNDREWPYRNFKRTEFASKDNGEFYWHQRTFDAVQRARDILAHPLRVNSGHRSWLYNIAIGGAPRSAHLFIALDISTRRYNRARIYHALKKAGFQSFGFYETFIHVDMRPWRQWYGSQEARQIWAPILARPIPEIV
jgi:uncharacterized protein YcbK (DUF882 family)